MDRSIEKKREKNFDFSEGGGGRGAYVRCFLEEKKYTKTIKIK
jgi:hypothetical protein